MGSDCSMASTNAVLIYEIYILTWCVLRSILMVCSLSGKLFFNCLIGYDLFERSGLGIDTERIPEAVYRVCFKMFGSERASPVTSLPECEGDARARYGKRGLLPLVCAGEKRRNFVHVLLHLLPSPFRVTVYLIISTVENSGISLPTESSDVCTF